MDYKRRKLQDEPIIKKVGKSILKFCVFLNEIALINYKTSGN